MKLFKNTLFALTAITAFFYSCQRHVVVPAPSPPIDRVEVDCNFQGLVDTANVLLQDDVNDYTCVMLINKKLMTPDCQY